MEKKRTLTADPWHQLYAQDHHLEAVKRVLLKRFEEDVITLGPKLVSLLINLYQRDIIPQPLAVTRRRVPGVSHRFEYSLYFFLGIDPASRDYQYHLRIFPTLENLWAESITLSQNNISLHTTFYRGN